MYLMNVLPILHNTSSSRLTRRSFFFKMHLSRTYLLVLLIAEKYNPAPRSYCELQLRTMNLTPSVTTSQGPLRHLVVGAQHPEARTLASVLLLLLLLVHLEHYV